MLRTSLPAHNAAVKNVVDRLLKEEFDFAQNRRSAHRTPLVRPAHVFVPGENEPRVGCTQNISPDGVGILLREPLQEGLTMKLQIHALHRTSPILVAQLRWCVPFGEGWYLSGWKFINEAR